MLLVLWFPGSPESKNDLAGYLYPPLTLGMAPTISLVTCSARV